MYYWKTNYYLKRHCLIFQNNLNLNQIYLRDENKVYLGYYKPRIWPVYIKWEKPGQKLVANAKKLQYPSLPFANIQTLRIREKELDLYFSDKKIEYVFLEEPIDRIKVLATYTNESQLAKKSSKEPIKQILY